VPQTIAIIDYSSGNLHSVYKKLSQLKAHPFIAISPSEILSADKIVIPGVGHFGKAIDNLKISGVYDALNEAAVVKKIPVLGICLGMQLMAEKSEEGNATGFGWIKGIVIRFRIDNSDRLKIPQTGWNTLNIKKESKLLKDLTGNEEFYFLHSYHMEVTDRTDILASTDFGYEYVSAIERENFFGAQFHPEKSHGAGSKILKNFIEL
jgi:imidazole glycerol-phosphate synthase subunit HisH